MRLAEKALGLLLAGLLVSPAAAQPELVGLACDVTVTFANQPRPGYTPPPPEVFQDQWNIVIRLDDHTWCYRDLCSKGALPITEITESELVLVRSERRTFTISQADGTLRDQYEIRKGEGRAISTAHGNCRKVTIISPP
jgi:hypothetical protein